MSKKFKESMYTPLQEFKINSTRRFYYNPNTLTKRQIRLNEYNKTFESSKILKKQKSSSSDSDSDSDKVPTTTTTKLVKIPATEEDRERDKQEEDKHRLVHESENNSLRQLSYDKRYVVLNDNISNFMGIYIIAVNNVLHLCTFKTPIIDTFSLDFCGLKIMKSGKKKHLMWEPEIRNPKNIKQ